MKKLMPITLCAAALLAGCGGEQQSEQGQPRQERTAIATVAMGDTVYVCTSEGAKRFHASDT